MKKMIFMLVLSAVFVGVQATSFAMGGPTPPEGIVNELGSQVLPAVPVLKLEIKFMYATQSDLQKKLKRFYTKLYDDGAGSIDTDLVNFDLEAAATEIDGSVAARYTVPVTASGAQSLLKNWNLDLACEFAFFRAGGSELPEKVKNAAELARKQLTRIVDGDFRLPADPAEKTSGVGNVALVSGADAVTTRDDLAGW